jgi:hypothetical protein
LALVTPVLNVLSLSSNWTYQIPQKLLIIKEKCCYITKNVDLL